MECLVGSVIFFLYGWFMYSWGYENGSMAQKVALGKVITKKKGLENAAVDEYQKRNK